MRAWINAVADRIVRNRSKLPRWVNRMLDSAARDPDGLIGRLAHRALGGGSAPVTEVPDAAVRVFIGPTNYSGQGFRWARALEQADPTVQAKNMEIVIPGGYSFAADTSVPVAATSSATWQEGEWAAVQRFSHVLIEAERPLFGRLFDRDIAAEVEALDAAGVSVAFLSHGTDIRNPREHARRTPWSPYPDDPRTEVLQADADENLALLTRLRRPTFVSTPDLLDELPWASWCPVVIDVQRFRTDRAALSGGTPRIIHSSSSAVQKGSHLIEPALAPLVDAGRVDYRLVTGVSSDRMPDLLAGADIVLDQFRLGSYGVAACEAMAAGRVVIGHVLPGIRERIEAEIGMPLPIVEADPDSLHDVVAGLLADPDRARAAAAAGPRYVEAVHSGARSAEVLLSEWIRSSA
ncbi:glycosyltransferase family protein [Microbacterium maritypicum]